MSRKAWLGAAVVAVLGGGAVFAHRHAPPNCRSDQVLHSVDKQLHERFGFNSVIFNDIRTVTNGFFGDTYACSAQVTELRGNVDASAMRWQDLQYASVYQHAGGTVAITIRLGGDVKLAPPLPTFLERLLDWF